MGTWAAIGIHPPVVESPTDAYAKILQLRNMQQEQAARAQQMQLGGLQMQGAQVDLQQKQYQLEQTRALNQAYQGALTVNPDGTADIDQSKITTALGQAGHGAAIPGVLENITKYKKASADLSKVQGEVATQEQDAAGALGASVKAANNDPFLFLTLTKHAVAAKHVDGGMVAPLINQVEQALTQDPSGDSARQIVGQLSDRFISGSPEQQKLANEKTQADARKQTADTSANRFDAEKPGLEADAAQKTRQNTAATLATATNPVDYTRKYDAIKDPELKKLFPAPEQWDPKNAPAAILRTGMKPDEIVQANQAAATLANTQQNQATQNAFRNRELGIQQQNANRGAEANDLKRVEIDPFGMLGVNKHPINPTGQQQPGQPPVKGEAFIQTLPQAIQARVRAISDGRETLSAREKGTPQGRALQTAVETYDPSWSEQRAQLRKAFTTGNDGRNIGNLNTATVHLEALAEAGKAMQNGSLVPGNQLYNAISTMFGGSAPTTFNGIKTVVAGEMASAMKGNATDPEIASFNKSVNDASSPGQLADVIKTAFLPAIGAKVNTYDERYHAQSSPDDQWSPVLPSAAAVFQKNGIQPIARLQQQAQPQNGRQPAPAKFKVNDKVMYQGKPHTVVAVHPDGSLDLDK